MAPPPPLDFHASWSREIPFKILSKVNEKDDGDRKLKSFKPESPKALTIQSQVCLFSSLRLLQKDPMISELFLWDFERSQLINVSREAFGVCQYGQPISAEDRVPSLYFLFFFSTLLCLRLPFLLIIYLFIFIWSVKLFAFTFLQRKWASEKESIFKAK